MSDRSINMIFYLFLTTTSFSLIILIDQRKPPTIMISLTIFLFLQSITSSVFLSLLLLHPTSNKRSFNLPRDFGNSVIGIAGNIRMSKVLTSIQTIIISLFLVVKANLFSSNYIISDTLVTCFCDFPRIDCPFRLIIIRFSVISNPHSK